MPPSDEVPEADRLEPEQPRLGESETLGIDAERSEPLSGDDWASTSPGA